MNGPIHIGKCYGTVGELWQGPWIEEDGRVHVALLALPSSERQTIISLSRKDSKARHAPPAKSSLALKILRDHFGIKDEDNIEWRRQRSLVEGVGMSSSTADIVATLKAAQQLYSIKISDDDLRSLLRKIERSDPVFSNKVGLYLSAEQRFVTNWQWRPNFRVVYALTGGSVTTDSLKTNELIDHYKQNIPCMPTIVRDAQSFV